MILALFFGKKMDFNSVSKDDVSKDDLVKHVNLINNHPKKRLSWENPFEVFHKLPVTFHSKIQEKKIF